jgi:hypothetical protein
MHPRINARRGGAYIFTLIVAAAAASIALAGFTLRRHASERSDLVRDLGEARLVAQSALELAMARIAEDSAWRTAATRTYTAAIGRGSASVLLDDPEDNDLANNPRQPVRLTSTAVVGTTRVVLRTTIIAPVENEYRDRVLAASPVAFWPLDEGTTTTHAAALVGPQHGGYSMNTVPNGFTGYDGRPAPAMRSSNALAFVPHHASFLINSGTIACWVFVDADSWGDQAIFAKNQSGNHPGSIYIYLGSSLSLTIRAESSTRTVSKSVSGVDPGRWNHIALTFGPAGLTAYINGDGTLVDNNYTVGLGTAAGGTNTFPIQIGAWYTGSSLTDTINGSIRDVAIFNRQLTAAQIDTLVFGAPGTPRIEPDAWAWVID